MGQMVLDGFLLCGAGSREPIQKAEYRAQAGMIRTIYFVPKSNTSDNPIETAYEFRQVCFSVVVINCIFISGYENIYVFKECRESVANLFYTVQHHLIVIQSELCTLVN